MATIGDWDKDAQQASTESLHERIRSLRALKTWALFDSSFEWTGIFVLIAILEAELEKRKHAEANAGLPKPLTKPLTKLDVRA